MRNIAVEGEEGSVSISGAYAGFPTPSVVLLFSNGSKIHKSHYTYSHEWWHLDSSVAREGGIFTLIASNCLSITNTSFTVNGTLIDYLQVRNVQTHTHKSFHTVRPRVDLRPLTSTACVLHQCKTHYFVIRRCHDVVIPLFIQGYPKPRVRLLFYNRVTSDYIVVTDDKRLGINTKHVLVLRSDRFNDSTSYRVELENIIGSAHVEFDIEVTDNDSRLFQCHNQSELIAPRSQECILPRIRTSDRSETEWQCQSIKMSPTTPPFERSESSTIVTDKPKLPSFTSKGWSVCLSIIVCIESSISCLCYSTC